MCAFRQALKSKSNFCQSILISLFDFFYLCYTNFEQMQKPFFLTNILLLLCFLSYSQDFAVKDTIVQDERIEWLIEQHRRINESQDGVPGFRVQIYADSGSRSKLRTEREKVEFNEKYPDIGTYLIYEEPYFKLRVGNFRTRLDARRFLEKISSKYEYAFIVPDKIEFPDFE